MIDFNFSVEGIRLNNAKLQAAVQRATISPLMKAGAKIQETAQRLVSRGGGKEHEPSLPGEPFRTQTGVARASISFAQAGADSVVVGPMRLHPPYQKWLEFGTAKMAKRPFMLPALIITVTKFPAYFKDLRLR